MIALKRMGMVNLEPSVLKAKAMHILVYLTKKSKLKKDNQLIKVVLSMKLALELKKIASPL